MGILDDLYQALFGNNNFFQDLSAPDQQPSQDQQPSEGYSFDYPINVTQIDSNGQSWRPANPFEQAVMGLKDVGSDIATDINKFLGVGNEDTGYRQDILGDWANVIDFDQDDSGNVDAGEVLGTVPRLGMAALNTVKALPGMMVEGFSEAPAYLGAGLTGSRMTQDDAYNYENNMVKEGELTPEERAGSAIYGALDVVPVGFGSVASKLGTNIAKKVGVDLFENVAENAARQGLKQAPDAINVLTAKAAQNGLGKGLATGIGLRAGEQFLEEGAEEAVQEAGLNALNDRDLNTNVLESFIGGGLAGGAMGGLRGAAKGLAYSVDQPSWMEQSGNNAQAPVADSFDTDFWKRSSATGTTLASVAKNQENEALKASKVPGVFSGLGYTADESIGANQTVLGSEQVGDILTLESTFAPGRERSVTNYLNSLSINRNLGDDLANAYNGIGDIRPVLDEINNELAARTDDQLLDFIEFKNPGGIQGPIKVKLKRIDEGSAIGVSQLAAIHSNGDYDGDTYSVMYDYQGNYNDVKRPMQILFGLDPNSNMKDLAKYFHINEGNWRNFANDLKQKWNGKVNFNNDPNAISNDITSQGVFDALIDTCVAELAGADPSTVAIPAGVSQDTVNKLHSGEFKDLESVFSYAYNKPAGQGVTSESLSADAAEALRSSVIVPSRAANNVYGAVASQIQPNSKTGNSGRSGWSIYGDNKDKGGLAIIERWRARLWTSIKNGDQSCREFLSIYFSIKDYAKARFNDGATQFTKDDLVQSIAKMQLGIEQDGVHPADIASSIIYESALSSMFETIGGRINNSNMSLAKTTFAEEYDHLSKTFRNSYVRTDQENNKIESDKTMALPPIKKNEDGSFDSASLDNIFAKAIMDKSLDRIFDAPKSMMAKQTIRMIVEDISFNEGSLQSYLEGCNEVEAKAIKKQLEICKAKIGNDQANASMVLRDRVKEIVSDRGIQEAFKNLDQAGRYRDMNTSDAVSVTQVLHALSFYSGNKDFEYFGFNTDEDFINAYFKGKSGSTDSSKIDCQIATKIVEGIINGNANNVVSAIEVMALMRRTKKVVKAINKLRIEWNNDNKFAVLKEIDNLSKCGPFYKAVASHLSFRVLGTESDIDAITEERINDAVKMLNTLISVNTDQSVRSSLISDMLLVMSDDLGFTRETVTSLILEDEIDVLNMTSPSSRCRSGEKYASLAKVTTNKYLSDKAKDLRAVIDGYLSTPEKKNLLMEELKQRAQINQLDVSAEIYVSNANLSERYNDDARDKTKQTPASQAGFSSVSVSQVGFSPDEFNNIAQGTISEDDIADNLFLSQMLLMTDYIKNVGSVTIHTNSGYTFTIESKRELIDILCGEKTGLSSDVDITFDDMWRMIEKHPALINIIEPLSRAYSDASGNVVESYYVKEDDKLANIAHTLSIEDEGSRNERTKERMRYSLITSKVLSSYKGLSTFAFSLFEDEDYSNAVTREEKSKAFKRFLHEKFVPAAVYYATSGEAQRSDYISKMTNGSLSNLNRDILDSFMLEDGKKLIYTGIDRSYSQTINDAFSTLLGDINIAPAVEMVSKTISDIIKKAEEIYGNGVSSNTQIVDLEQNIKEITDKLQKSMDAMLSSFNVKLDENRLEDMMPVLGCVEAIGILSDPHYEKDINLRIIDAYKEALNKSSVFSKSIIELENSIESARSALSNAHLTNRNTQPRQQANYDDAMVVLDFFFEELEKLKEEISSNVPISVIKAANDIDAFSLKAIDIANIKNTTKDEFCNECFELLNNDHLDSSRKKELEDAINEYKNGTEDDSVSRRKFMAEILARKAAQKLQETSYMPKMRIDLISSMVENINDFDEVLTDPELVTQLNQYQTVTNGNPPIIKMNMYDRDKIYAASQFIFNSMSGNPQKQTSLTASKRSYAEGFAFMPENPMYSPLRDDVKFYDRDLKDILDDYNNASDEDKELFQGWRADGTRISLTDISNKALTPDQYAGNMVQWRLQIDEAPAYDRITYSPDRSGSPFNQLHWILNKILVGIEPIALKTKKNLSAFTTASFSISSAKTKARVDASKQNIISAATIPDAYQAFRDMIKNVKGLYREEVADLVNGKDNPRSAMGLTHSDIKVLADTVIQGVVLKMNDGSEKFVSLVDMMNGVQVLEDADLQNIMSVHVPIYDLSELGREITKKVYQSWRRGLGARQSAPTLNQMQAKFHETVGLHGSMKVADSFDVKSKELGNVFNNLGKPKGYATDTFIEPSNSAILFNESMSGKVNATDVFSDNYKNYNDSSTIPNVVRKFGNFDSYHGEIQDDDERLKTILKDRDKHRYGFKYSTVIDLDSLGTDELKNGIEWARNHGTSIVFVKSNTVSRFENENDTVTRLLAEAGYTENLNNRLSDNSGKSFRSIVYVPVNQMTKYVDKHSTASIKPYVKDHNTWATVFSDEFPFGDGEFVFTEAGVIEWKSRSETPGFNTTELFDFTALSKPTNKVTDIKMIKYADDPDRIRNFSMTEDVAQMFAERYGYKKDDSKLIKGIENSVARFIAQINAGRNTDPDNLYITSTESRGRFTCLGMAEVVMEHGSQLVPMIVETETNAKIGLNVVRENFGGKEHVVGYEATIYREMFSDDDKFRVVKTFWPSFAVKATAQINNPIRNGISYVAGIRDNAGFTVHTVANYDFNGKKFDISLAKREWYTHLMRETDSSMFFKKIVDDKTGDVTYQLQPWLANMKYGDGSPATNVLNDILAYPEQTRAVEAWRKIAYGDVFLDFRNTEFDGNELGKTALMTTIRACVDAQVDPMCVISSFVPKSLPKELLNGNASLGSATWQSDEIMQSMWTEDYGLTFDGLMENYIQELFSIMMPDDIEPAWNSRKRDGFDYRYDVYGKMHVEGLPRDKRYYVALTSPPKFDATRSDWRATSNSGSLGNKINQFNYFSGQGGNRDMIVADALSSVGASRASSMVYDDLKTENNELTPKHSFNSEAMGKLNALRGGVTVHQDLYTLANEKHLRDIIKNVRRDFYAPDFPIRGKNGKTIDMRRTNDGLRFANEDVEEMYERAKDKWGFSKTGMTTEEFMLIMKTAFAYTKSNEDDSFSGFDIDEVDKAIDTIAKNLKETGLPVTPAPISMSGKSSRYGICVLPQELYSLFATKCEHTISKFTDQVTGKINQKSIEETMLDFHFQQRTNMHDERYQKRVAIANMATTFARGTGMENASQLATTRSGITVADAASALSPNSEVLYGKNYSGWDLIQQMGEANKKAFEHEAYRIKNRRLRWGKIGENGVPITTEGYEGGWSLQKYADNLIAAKQVMAVSTPFLFPASIMDRFVMLTPLRALMKSSIYGKLKGVGLDSRVLEKVGSQQKADMLSSKARELSHNPDFLGEFGAVKTLFNMQDMDVVVAEAKKKGMSLKQYCDSEKANSNIFKKAASVAFDWASGKQVGNTFQAEVFIDDFIRRASLDPNLRALWNDTGDGMNFIDRMIDPMNPTAFISQCFDPDSPFKVPAMQAFNTAMKGDACQKTIFSILVNEICASNGAVGFFAKTFISPFMQYGINITSRHMNAILPMSSLNYIITKLIKDKNVPGMRTIDPITGKITHVDWKALGIEETLTATSLRDALVQDMAHMGIVWTAAIVLALGCLEPPDDDDEEKWCNVDEWTFMGQRISMNWWVKDTIGPVLGIACAMRSAQEGKPNMAVLMKTMTECISSNPIYRSSDLVNMLFDPYGEYMEAYYDDMARYENTSDGGPSSAAEVLAANFSVAGMNWATGFILPSFVKELYTHSTDLEKSYKKVYETNAQGQLTEAGAAGKTVYTDYFDAKIRLATRKNPILAAVMDFLFKPTTGYFASEMPNTVYYDPAQMESMQEYSLYTTDEYGNSIPKSDTECEAIAMKVILKLQQYDDMQQLRDTGFAIPYDTMKYVGNMIYDIAYAGAAQYQAALNSGALDYTELGDGDYNLGKQRAEELAAVATNTSNYWKSMYYDKLWSDEMKSGIAMYNRYNTTYAQDANGEWYATGFRNNYADLMMPWATAPDTRDQARETMGFGIEGNDWATRSVVTGESTGERALIPYTVNIKTPEFGGNKTPLGYSPTYRGFSYGYRGGGGGGGYKSRPSSYYYKVPTNTYNYVKPYGENFSTPKANTTPYKYGKELADYSFYSKGSREANKRGDM